MTPGPPGGPVGLPYATWRALIASLVGRRAWIVLHAKDEERVNVSLDGEIVGVADEFFLVRTSYLETFVSWDAVASVSPRKEV